MKRHGGTTTPKTLRQVFAMPLLLAAFTLIGLLSALLGDGIWDFISWLTLGFLIAVVAYHWLKPGTQR